jgi:hypothetical protein
MSTLFYSQVNAALQQELVTRGSVGTNYQGQALRSTDDMNFMVGKIANVELRAYDSQPTVNSKPLPGFGTLGGVSVLGNSYMPSGPNGFLNKQVRPTHRIPPVITGLTVGIKDTSKNFINTANITISIPDGTTDLDQMEEIYGAPGRYIQVRIVHPDSAVITGKLLDDEGLPSKESIQSFFPDVNFENLKKMNEVFFTGRISNFTYNFAADGSIEFSIDAIGVSNTYAEVQLVVKNQSASTQTSTEIKNEVSNIYTDLIDIVSGKIDEEKQKNPGIVEFEYLEPGTTDQGIIVGRPYVIGNSDSTSVEQMVSLGYLINYLNKFVLNKVDNSIILCDDTICKSNFFERLVSANPLNILLWSGKSEVKTDLYTYTLKTEPPGLEKATLQMFPNVKAVSPGFAIRDTDMNKSYPSRIYINLQVIKSIFDEIQKPGKNGVADPTVRNFLNKLSEVIRKNTGEAINLALVQDAEVPEGLLFYDINFVLSDKYVTEFILPAYATKTGRSIVRELSLTNQVPDSVKNLIFGVTSPNSGVQKQVAYAPWIYTTGETRKRIEEDWKLIHIEAVQGLADITNTYAQRPTDAENNKKLEAALTKYITYFTPNIRESMNTNKATFQMELEFTIDGINGFKFGDVLNFNGIPRRYRDAFVFTVQTITQTVGTDGEWTTKITCGPRVKAYTES